MRKRIATTLLLSALTLGAPALAGTALAAPAIAGSATSDVVLAQTPLPGTGVDTDEPLSNDGQDDTGKYGLIGLSGLLGLFGYRKYKQLHRQGHVGVVDQGSSRRF